MVLNCIVDILQGCNSFLVIDVYISLRGYFVKIDILSDDLVGAVSGDIVDDDCEVVCVILHEDGVQVELDPKVGIIVVGRHDDAHWDFRMVV
jgi:hypothetical protein